MTTNKISIVVKNNFNELMKEAAAEEVARSFVVVDASRKDQNIEGMGPKLAGLEMTGISVMVLCNAKDTRTFDSCKIIEADNKAPKLAAEQIASELNKRITNSPRGHRPAARQ
ncbi:MAG: hypothetical protein SFW63_01205 [Alphaproteobacteria bacterium]|nr:hypothetical protein [Alphaproteobacteria bacterium]